MKVINVLAALVLVYLPTMTFANNLPFVGKRNFHLEGFDGNGGIKQIEINKNGRIKIISIRCSGVSSCRTITLYQGKYRSVIPIDQGEYIQYVRVLNKNQIAYTDKYGNILPKYECGLDENEYCITDLTKPFR